MMLKRSVKHPRIPLSGGESELLKEWFTVSEIFFHFGVQSCYNMV